MAETTPVVRVVEAGADAAAARRFVMLLQAAALSGGQHDPEVFDAAVVSDRIAQRRTQLALQALGRAGRPTGTRPTRRAA